jgi:hypothetical protein
LESAVPLAVPVKVRDDEAAHAVYGDAGII